MKNIIILAAMLIAISTSSFAADSKIITVTSATLPCSVYVNRNNIVVENLNAMPAEVTITGKFGKQVSKSNVSGKKQIPVKELQEGKYTIKVKTGNTEQTIKLDVL